MSWPSAVLQSRVSLIYADINESKPKYITRLADLQLKRFKGERGIGAVRKCHRVQSSSESFRQPVMGKPFAGCQGAEPVTACQ